MLNTLGTRWISTSRTVPPPTPVIAPRMIACARPTPSSSALPAPVTANRLSPAASSTSIRLVNRVSQRLNMNAINPRRQLLPGNASRRTWPAAGRKQDVTNDAPTDCGDHAEGDNPDDVQMRGTDGGQHTVQRERERPRESKTSSTGGSDTADVYRIAHRDPSQTVTVGPVSSTGVEGLSAKPWD